MSRRYKPVGWRGEPHRHYLASKGIKTNGYFKWKNMFENSVDYEVVDVPLETLWYMRAEGQVDPSTEVIFTNYSVDKPVEDELREKKKEQTGREYVYVSNEDVIRERARRKQKELENQGYTVFPWKVTFQEGNEFRPIVRMKYRKPSEERKGDLQQAMRPVKSSERDFGASFGPQEENEAYVKRIAQAIESDDKEVPMIELSKNRQNEMEFGEGRHRLNAARLLGLETVPVSLEKGDTRFRREVLNE